MARFKSVLQRDACSEQTLIAAAVKGSDGKRDLNLRYKDSGEAIVSPSWFDGGMKKKEEGQNGLVKS